MKQKSTPRKAPTNDRAIGRRRFLALSGALGTLALPSLASVSSGETGLATRSYDSRSPFEKSVRYFDPNEGISYTPLGELCGIITPSALHYEVDWSDVPGIDPRNHKLVIHGLVEQPLVLTMEDLKRMPSVSRVHFLECSGNTGEEGEGKPQDNLQRSHGLASCSEWTGVPLSTLLAEVGLKSDARWILAEGADARRLARSLPLAKAMDDAIVAYGQNGEALRPGQGYPLRLIVPGWVGNTNVKWLHRLHVLDQPAMTAYEAAYYTHLLPCGMARQFVFVMRAKSVITRPAGGQKLNGPGFYEITGLAWSGSGKISTVEISTDGGQFWRAAELQNPIHSKAFTRFRMPWTWDGQETTIASRCRDETGYWQPTREQFLAERGTEATGFYNGIKWWRVPATGMVTHA